TLRGDPRVVVMERTNIRHVLPDKFEEPVDFATIDVSFISLKLVLPVLKTLIKDGGQAVCLIKPQFEAGRDQVGKKGVVRDAAVHRAVLDAFCGYATESGFQVKSLDYSPIKGPEGNIEFLAHLSSGGAGGVCMDAAEVVERAHRELKGAENHDEKIPALHKPS
ncbi:TlyA family RNA methyltransferase, partial [Oscillospiraceae bacterium OttesenSCG-928-F05]|nr:TlyA family RNA methyltransferase [Oscillospiraceae bacterium OttesenSCG-928-F05]